MSLVYFATWHPVAHFAYEMHVGLGACAPVVHNVAPRGLALRKKGIWDWVHVGPGVQPRSVHDIADSSSILIDDEVVLASCKGAAAGPWHDEVVWPFARVPQRGPGNMKLFGHLQGYCGGPGTPTGTWHNCWY
jgi:hypothetical protein